MNRGQFGTGIKLRNVTILALVDVKDKETLLTKVIACNHIKFKTRKNFRPNRKFDEVLGFLQPLEEIFEAVEIDGTYYRSFDGLNDNYTSKRDIDRFESLTGIGLATKKGTKDFETMDDSFDPDNFDGMDYISFLSSRNPFLASYYLRSIEEGYYQQQLGKPGVLEEILLSEKRKESKKKI